MSFLKLNEPEKTEAELKQEQKESGIRAAIIVTCIFLAYYTSFDQKSGHLDDTLARAIGGALGKLVIPAILALIAKRFTEKWHYVFGGVFLVILIVNLAARFAK